MERAFFSKLSADFEIFFLFVVSIPLILKERPNKSESLGGSPQFPPMAQKASEELITDAPSPVHLRKRELGCRNFNASRWKRPLEENRLQSLRIIGRIPVVFNRSAASTCLDIDRNEHDFMVAGSSKGGIDVVNLRYVQGRDDMASYFHRHTHENMVNSIQWYSRDISMFVTGSQDGTVKVWDTDRQKPFDTYLIENPKQIHWNEVDKKNPLIAVCDHTSNVRLIDCRTGNSAQNIRNKSEVRALRWYHSEKLLSTGDSQGNLFYWDIRNCRQHLRKISIGSSAIAAIRFSSDGRYLVSVDAYILQVFIFDALTLELLLQFRAIEDTVERPHPNSRHLVLVEEGEYLRIGVPTPDEKFSWTTVDMERRTIVKQQLLSGHLNKISACAYRPTHQELYTASIGFVIKWSSEGERARSNLETESHYNHARLDDWSDSD